MIDLTGKCAVVTGATSGIGEATAKGLAAMGADVILVARSTAKLKATSEAIADFKTGATVASVKADLSNQAEVRRAAQEILTLAPRIDILVNNAGGIFMERQESADGLEMTFALDHMAYFLLTKLLLERIEQTAQAHGGARIVSVASDLHRRVKAINWDDLQRKAGSYSGLDAYNTNKLFNVLFTAELDRKLQAKGSKVIANCLHPGVVASGFGHGTGGFIWKTIMKIGGLFMITPEDGARTSLFLASEDLEPHHHGMYFNKCQPVRPNPLALDDQNAKRLWDISEQLC